MSTYLDSSVVIHATAESDFGARLRAAIDSADPSVNFSISPLVRMESLVRPIRDRDENSIANRLLVLESCTSLPIREHTYELATHIRAMHGVGSADAIHLATASLSDCSELWTSDKQIVNAAPNFAVDVTERF
ncbi:MAG: PIN domain-containing protein [Solirubrobacterales bacterium]|nr:PIN domain-containing protein [Solirubrobacterales bacterium]